ncbi:hypothetical protein QM467_00675 [Rhodoblastus sp. 17X3]|uniref:hypothetical protein n=1 Tax=Rhodoblastus sp. 17X3 TaxID=3047026 RepID=UPI0024B775D0|nr:hypothetical protein [Rhodoblastus sp. 17X3]MDI9846565.1 hypothetical protein [Rhodoblastus sp. 17X3]
MDPLIITPDLSPWERGALFLSALAFPNDRSRRAKFEAGIYLTMRNGAKAASRRIPRIVDVLLSVSDIHELEKAASSGWKIIQTERLIAEKMAWPEAHAAAFDIIGVSRPADVPKHFSNAMLNAVDKDVADRRTNNGPGRRPESGDALRNDENIKFRKWKPSIPSLHLALAYRWECGDDNGLSFGDILDDDARTRRLVGLAISFRRIIQDVLKIQENQLLQILLEN